MTSLLLLSASGAWSAPEPALGIQRRSSAIELACAGAAAARDCQIEGDVLGCGVDELRAESEGESESEFEQPDAWRGAPEQVRRGCARSLRARHEFGVVRHSRRRARAPPARE